MKRTLRNSALLAGVFGAAIIVTAVLPARAAAQVYITQTAPRGWLGITYDESIVIHGNQRSGALTITEVAKGSPAERAGLQAGDTVSRVNGFRATTEVLRSMGASVEPGDTVHMVVRRGGRDREIDIEVAKRPPQTFVQGRPGAERARIYTYDPDSVRGMMKLFVDSMYAGLDTSRMRIFRFDTAGFMRLNGDSMFMGSLPMTAFRYGMFGDSLPFRSRAFMDSMFNLPRGVWMDSMFSRLPTFHDSLFSALPRNGAMLPPQLFDEVRTPDIVFRSFARGASAFAGADLTDMNPDLGEYFGTKNGVLVLAVPDGTPAARAGLEAGDIVTKVDGAAVSSVVELRRTVEKARRGAPIKLEIVRHQKSRTVELKRD
jgi:membrane-associated protease RseP (regulator of RpoE activity)